MGSSMGSSMEAIYSGSDQSWNLASRFLSVEVVLLTLVWSQESSRECGSNMDIILDIFDIIFTLLSQCYKQNSISVYYLRQKLSFYLKCECFGQSVHKKKNYYVISYSCACTTFSSVLQLLSPGFMGFFPNLWKDCFYEFLNIDQRPFLSLTSFFLHPINPWLFLWVSLCMSVLFSLCLCSTNSWRMSG